jgi:CHAT domain-containing protein
LKWSEKEVENVQAALGKAGFDAQVIKGWQATEESFKQIGQSGPSPRILHVSTHGFFFPDPVNPQSAIQNPLSEEPVFKLSDHPMIRSGLILAGANHAWKAGRPLGNREDGILTAYEISQLDLRNTELVVLSACETGLGHIDGNEGVFGLQRAFKIAGAKTLVMSLWQVPDYQTQELMTVFYEKLLTGKLAPRLALRAAQDEMRKRHYEPYYWAGFVVVE